MVISRSVQGIVVFALAVLFVKSGSGSRAVTSAVYEIVPHAAKGTAYISSSVAFSPLARFQISQVRLADVPPREPVEALAETG